MARIHLVTGGARSGKSKYAQTLAESFAGPHGYVATCPVLDEEMAERIARHRQDRAGKGWQTIEEQLDLTRVFQQETRFSTLLVDCLTLWINNLIFAAQTDATKLGEDEVTEYSRSILTAARAREAGNVIFVTNEVGLGIVPENALARRFRDLAGRCNQTIGREAETITMLVCGHPLKIKDEGNG